MVSGEMLFWSWTAISVINDVPIQGQGLHVALACIHYYNNYNNDISAEWLFMCFSFERGLGGRLGGFLLLLFKYDINMNIELC